MSRVFPLTATIIFASLACISVWHCAKKTGDSASESSPVLPPSTPNPVIWSNSGLPGADALRARAEELYKERGQIHQKMTQLKKEMDDCNAEASRIIFEHNNRKLKQGWVDLHGLYTTEAVDYALKSIDEAHARGSKKISLIVGKGNRSADGIAKIGPRIMEQMQRRNVDAKINEGVVVVTFEKET